jgi:DNA-binding protein Fis
MADQEKGKEPIAIATITPELKKALNETRSKLKGSDRRRFMAQIVMALGPGGQSRAQRELGWNRNVIIKGTKELKSNIRCDVMGDVVTL